VQINNATRQLEPAGVTGYIDVPRDHQVAPMLEGGHLGTVGAKNVGDLRHLQRDRELLQQIEFAGVDECIDPLVRKLADVWPPATSSWGIGISSNPMPKF
jgi:hypothetical protein